MIKTPEGSFEGSVISVPPSLFPGVINALHLRLEHPSKAQLTSLVSRYFYAPGWRAMIDEVSNNCHQCSAVRQLPKVLLDDTSATPSGLASNFAVDIIERHQQKILIIRECLSQYTRGLIIPDQKMETLRDAIFSLIIDILPDNGTEIRTDAATGFQKLRSDAETPSSMFHKLGIKIIIGRILNKNKNPTAENANKEILKEILRHTNRNGPISPTELALVLKNVNSRIRYNNLSSKEILFRRNMLTNEPLPIADETLKSQQASNRERSSIKSQKSKKRYQSKAPEQTFSVGDLVFLRNGHDKNNPREMYIVEEINEAGSGQLLIRKLHRTLRNRLYHALPDELILASSPMHADVPRGQPLTASGRPLRKAAMDRNYVSSCITNPRDSAKYKHGWNPEDQYTDSDFSTYIYDLSHSPYEDPEDPTSDNTSTTSYSSPTPNVTPTSNLDLIDSDSELQWDQSPEQYELVSDTLDVESLDTEFNDDPEVFQDVQPSLPFPKERSRRNATSLLPLSRSDAFRVPRRNQQNVQMNVNDSHSRQSRIPLPTSPSHVELQNVADISIVAPVALEALGYTTPPQRSLPPSSVPQREPRKTTRAFNYRIFHNTGFKKNAAPRNNVLETRTNDELDARVVEDLQRRELGGTKRRPRKQDNNSKKTAVTSNKTNTQETQREEEEQVVTQPSAASNSFG